MVDKLVELARGKLNIGEDKQGNAKYMPVSPATQLTAAEALLDRGYGRPAQAIELAGKDGGPIVHESESAYDIICRRIEVIRQRLIEDGHLPRALSSSPGGQSPAMTNGRYRMHGGHGPGAPSRRLSAACELLAAKS